MRTDAILIGFAAIALAGLLSRRLRRQRLWRATITPLASIIGSGFLVVVPLLGHTVGGYSWFGMLAVVVLAYLTGAIVRFNIRHVEPLLLDESSDCPSVHRVEAISDLCLAAAYFISVAFYLRLLSAFVLRGLDLDHGFLAPALTTALLLLIGTVGVLWGLKALERLEIYSVSIKLAIISSLVLGWLLHDVQLASTGSPIDLSLGELDGVQSLRVLAGVLIVVQGFETSRYLGEEYDAETRIRTMRWPRSSQA